MKKIIYIIFCIFTNASFAQKVMTTQTAVIHFEASVPLYEEVTAKNKTVSATLNLKNGQLTSLVQMKDFRFKLSLMEEHFNKKYLETDLYPQATFKGTIEGFTINSIDTTTKEFKLKGELKIHGKTKKISTIAFLKKEGNGLEIISEFKVQTKDFNIQIPEILSMKVAETATISCSFLVQ